MYLFFSANGTGHISAFGELISNKKRLSDLPDIWYEKNRYKDCFMVRFLIVKEVPMNNFIHLKNLEGKEMRRCRDTSKIGFQNGLFMAKTCIEWKTTNSLLVDLHMEV